MTERNNTSSDAGQCPLCGAGNQCAVAAGKPIDQCWCYGANIAAEALSRIPAAARGRQCLCPHCGAPQGVSRER